MSLEKIHFPDRPYSSRACSNPILIPPKPENKSINLIDLSFELSSLYILSIPMDSSFLHFFEKLFEFGIGNLSIVSISLSFKYIVTAFFLFELVFLPAPSLAPPCIMWFSFNFNNIIITKKHFFFKIKGTENIY